MKGNETMYMLTVIVVGIIIIIKIFIVCEELSNRTLEDYIYIKGYVAKVDSNNKVWVVKDSSVNIHSLATNENYLIFEVRDSEVFIKLKKSCKKPNHIIEIWYAKPGKSRKNFPEILYPIIQQIVLDKEIIMPYDKNISWKGFICISIPILTLIIFCIKALIGNDKID
ncbi:MAG: hypothetical protein IKQ46_05255 [Bacteroidales bacterium]|nr:hypothetical protein [Bacteroidales bacterium]